MQSVKRKAESVNSGSETPSKKIKLEESAGVWKWWEEEKYEDVKWKTLVHKGPVFAPAYEPLPHDIQFLYNGNPVKLNPRTEEVASFYAKMLDSEFVTKDTFNRNFFKDWKNIMTEEEKSLITSLKKCNFKPIFDYYKTKTEYRKHLSKEEKQRIKDENAALTEEYGFCTIDGHLERIGNFKIEPPGLFRGRGDHPKMGKVKKRIEPEDVIINCSPPVPNPPFGRRWKEVREDNTVTWLACWTDTIQGDTKYVMLNASSKLKCEKDWKKFELARDLREYVEKIRAKYSEDFHSEKTKVRQRAVALYFIDKLALRAGNEKDDDEEADTVGCCSLRAEHVKLFEDKPNNIYTVDFDFLGKDSVRYQNSVQIPNIVYRNLQIFLQNKKPGDELFDRISTTSLNRHLNEQMDGLTAKVFRTFNASVTLQNQLQELTKPGDDIQEKILAYMRANREVAVLCNHQRAISKSYNQSMESLTVKILTKKTELNKAEETLSRKTKEDEQYQLVKKTRDRLREQLNKLEIQATTKEETKDIALGTSKLNYLDPRITVAWCKKWDVPMEKIYNRAQRDKFRWAIEMAGPDFIF